MVSVELLLNIRKVKQHRRSRNICSKLNVLLVPKTYRKYYYFLLTLKTLNLNEKIKNKRMITFTNISITIPTMHVILRSLGFI